MHEERLYYEDLEPGMAFETERRTITAEDLATFTQLSGDYNPLHTDASYATASAFGDLIVQGALVLSIGTGLANSLGFLDGAVEAFTALNWKYRAPVKVGDTIRVYLRVKKKRSMPGYDGGLVILDVVIYNQEDRGVQKGTWTLLVRGRERARELIATT